MQMPNRRRQRVPPTYMGMTPEQFFTAALPGSTASGPTVQNFGMLSSGTPMASTPNSQVVLSNWEIEHSPFARPVSGGGGGDYKTAIGNWIAGGRQPDQEPNHADWNWNAGPNYGQYQGGSTPADPNAPQQFGGKYGDATEAVLGLRLLAQQQNQAAYNDMMGSGNYGGMIGPNYASPWGGITPGSDKPVPDTSTTPQPDANNGWFNQYKDWGWASPALPGGQRAYETGGEGQSSMWGGPWSNQNPWSAGL
jgi:hypothetical protein